VDRRGPKPVDMSLLDFWEFEWYKALHVLRDGTALPGSRALTAPPLHITPAIVRSWVRRLREMGEEEWLRINERACEEISGKKDLDAHTSDPFVLRDWARWEKEREIADLETYLNPRQIPAQAERRELWRNFWQARTLPALKKVCEQWASLPDVRGWGLTCFPNHILANAREFLRMKRNSRFPKSDSPVMDESRLEYLARGMAGILADVSPMTGIERLRNMKHTQGGPLWTKEPGGLEYCNCWRCRMASSRRVYKWGAEGWWNGMVLFMELACVKGSKKTKVEISDETARNL